MFWSANFLGGKAQKFSPDFINSVLAKFGADQRSDVGDWAPKKKKIDISSKS